METAFLPALLRALQVAWATEQRGDLHTLNSLAWMHRLKIRGFLTLRGVRFWNSQWKLWGVGGKQANEF